jgi:histidine decarboxylase
MAPAEADHTRSLLAQFVRRMQAEETSILGFPGNLRFDHSEFASMLSVFANNVYDPFTPDSSNVGAKDFEQAVLAFLTDLTRGDPAGTYGYLTSGGSEGNLWGLSVARHTLPQATVYTSTAAHPSIMKAIRLLRMPVQTVPTMAGGRDAMDPEALRELAAARPGGAIVAATVGTTMTGDSDDVPQLRAAASASGPVHVHVDAALSGFIAPFTGQRWDFPAGADTIAVSAHKALGMPVPCGIALGREALVPDWETGQYTGGRDRTLSCSRSGLAATLLWASLRDLGHEGLRRQAEESLRTAAYAQARLSTIVEARRHPHSIIIPFTLPRPTSQLLALCASAHLPVVRQADGTVLTHVVTVPHVTREAIDRLVAALTGPRDGTRRW